MPWKSQAPHLQRAGFVVFVPLRLRVLGLGFGVEGYRRDQGLRGSAG